MSPELRVVREGLHLERLDGIRSGFFAEATEGDRHPGGEGWTAFGKAQPTVATALNLW